MSDDYKGGTWNFRDCQFHGAQVSFAGQICALNVGLTNCLFERTKLYADGSNVTLHAYNNLFYQGDVWLISSNTANAFTFRDNFFDCNNLTNWIVSGALTNDHNGYMTNYNQLSPNETGAVIVTNFTFQSSWLGNYYQPANSPLIDAGSTTADQLGLYHYTTQTNQVMEANTLVDIGYHYMAVDTNGNPIPWAYPPIITQQPASQAVVQGTNVTFSVTVSTNSTLPLSYQWRLNGVNIPNAINSSYTRLVVLPSDAGTYSVVIVNEAGGVTSTNATLTVLVPIAITQEPTNQTVVQGGTTTFAVNTTGTAPAYQWQVNGANIPGATSSSYTQNNVQPAAAGNYTVVVTNAVGSVTSAPRGADRFGAACHHDAAATNQPNRSPGSQRNFQSERNGHAALELPVVFQRN